MKQEDMELQVWEYIDGACAESVRSRISALIANDPAWENTYRELMELHTGISENLDAGQPSMRFTKNVIDTVTALQMAPAAKKYINRGLIQGIAAFFIAIIMAGIVYGLISENQNSGSHEASSYSPLHMKNIDFTGFFHLVIAVNIVLGLLLADLLLRKKRKQYLD